MKIKLWLLSITSAVLLVAGFAQKNLWHSNFAKIKLINLISSIKLPSIIGISLEGRYAMYSGDCEYYKAHGSMEQTLIGSLQLQGGSYFFVPEKCFINLALSECTKKSSDAREKLWLDQYVKDRFLFLTKSQGKYSIQYEPKIHPYTVLENQEDGEILVRINFDPEQTYINSLTPDRVFLIRNIKDAKKLRFHSTISEVEWWSIRKYY